MDLELNNFVGTYMLNFCLLGIFFILKKNRTRKLFLFFRNVNIFIPTHIQGVTQLLAYQKGGGSVDTKCPNKPVVDFKAPASTR